MNWLEISVTTDGEAAEAVTELFNRHVQGGAVIETPVDPLEPESDVGQQPHTVIVKGYLPLDGTAHELRSRLEEGLWHLCQIYPIPEPVFRELAESDWLDAWKRQYHRLRVGRRIVIVPAWEEYTPETDEADQVVIHLEPGMAFGTGLHPTTRLCLEALEAHLTPGDSVLDVGTGSGILAIVAAKLGARSVLALEADPRAVTVAQENTAANGVAEQVAVRHGSLPGGAPRGRAPRQFGAEGPLEMLDSGQFDLVLVNILAPVIIGMSESLATRTRPEGLLIAAGLTKDQEDTVRHAFQTGGLQIIERAQEKDWVSLVAQRR
ncbi:MAG: 50S ribosomal protein L11 methyltransferase [Anaerolineae bacterium]|jgi:ribosomal protein L11 methyltransferase